MSDEKNRKLADCYKWRGQSHQQAGDDALGIQDLEKAIELYGDGTDADDYMNLGFAFRQKADNTEDSEEKKEVVFTGY